MEDNNIKNLIDDIREQNEVERKYLKKQLNINSIDFEKLNKSIDDFNSVISPLSDFFGRFK